MGAIRISQAVSSTETSLSPLVIFDSTDTASSYYIYISRDDTGERSGDLGFAYDGSHPWWSKSYTFSGLTPGTAYNFTAEVTHTGTGQTTTYLYAAISTIGTKPVAPTDAVSVIHYSSSGTTINMQVTNAYGATSIDWSTPFGNYTRTVQSVPYIETFYAPEYGTEYVIGANGWNSAGYAPRQKLAYSMTEPKIPGLSSGGSANNTIMINVNMSGGWDRVEIEMWTIDATSKLSTQTKYSDGSQSFSVTFGNLVANASYLFRGISYKAASYAGGYAPNSGYGGWLTVKNDKTRPANWVWTTASDSNGHKISGATFAMLATEWNTFTNRINGFRDYKGLAAYSFSNAVKGNSFMFYMFNEAKTSIEAMNTTGVAQKTTGDDVLAANLNSLMNGLNNIA